MVDEVMEWRTCIVHTHLHKWTDYYRKRCVYLIPEEEEWDLCRIERDEIDSFSILHRNGEREEFNRTTHRHSCNRRIHYQRLKELRCKLLEFGSLV